MAPIASEEAAAGETLYTVKKNDTLTSIAKAHGGIKVKALQEANNLKTSQIKPGQKLKLPAKSSAAPMGAAGSGAASLGASWAVTGGPGAACCGAGGC